MRFIQKMIFLCIICVSQDIFAEKMLVPPNTSTPECFHSYEEANQPKRANDVMAAMVIICKERGGKRVLHKLLDFAGEEHTSLEHDEETNDFAGLILTCIGEHANEVLFSCMFPTAYENL